MQQHERATIPILDLSPEVEFLLPELMRAVEGVLRSGEYIMGPNVKALESEVAEYLHVKHAIGVNSGTDALVIALRALGVGPGDEVITTPFTFFATAEAVSILGATPVFVDIDPLTYNLDPFRVEEAITLRTKAIIPVHLYGQAVDMDPIMSLAAAYGLKVLEDVAQGMGGEYKGDRLGTIGQMGALSFFPSKNLGAFGDGGMIVTNDDQLAETARMLRVHGARKKYHNEVVGYNSRLDELQAAMLRVKLPYLEVANEGRREVARRYNDMLGRLPGLVTPYEAHYCRHVYHQYTVRVLDGRRDALQQALAEAGISTMIYYPVPVHKLPLYRDRDERMILAEEAQSQVLSLPIWPQMPADTQRQVVGALSNAMASMG
ncbi:MAG: DegT/DnrJ/EryC1/StrS family aminotransferase [Candidatus Sericytochromatia bacterium]